MFARAEMRIRPARDERFVLAASCAVGISSVLTQLAVMRELLGAFSGNEMTLGVVLGLWFLLMGVGSWLGRLSGGASERPGVLPAPLTVLAIVPLLQVILVRALRDRVFVRGADPGPLETVAACGLTLLPYCLVAGFCLALACRIVSREAGPEAVGRVYLADSVGSVVGGILFSFVFVGSLDHLSMLLCPAMLNLLLAGVMGFYYGRSGAGGAAVALLGVVAVVAARWDLDQVSTAWQHPGQRVLARANSPYGKLVVTGSESQVNFFENGLPILTTRDDQRVEETVHYAMAQRPEARAVLLVSGGLSGTATEILKYGVNRVDYVELDPLLLQLGREFLPENLSDSRIRVINTDGRRFIRQSRGQYDVVIVDAPEPSTLQLNRLYTQEFLAEAKRTLITNGVVSFSLGHYENYVSPGLARLLSSARLSLAPAFRNLLVIPGGRVCYLASDGPLSAGVAARLEARGIRTKLVNRNYLDATLAADRMSVIADAVAQPAAPNRDFSPVLYYYHIRHWMTQFRAGFGVLQAGLIGLLVLYLARLRGAAFAIFASGFAGATLELVLLLAFQVLCGSVYREVGVIVTVFMAGLAAGAWLTNRPGAGASRGSLALLAGLLAGYAAALPLLLLWLNRSPAPAAPTLWIELGVVGLTLPPALLTGMQFPVAARLVPGAGGALGVRLFTADFMGASLGALLASTLLLPLIGVSRVCLAVAGLNILAAVMVRWRKA